MIVYNVTIKVENEIADAWLQWLLQEHIPDVIGTGCFENAHVHRLIEIDDTEGPTYSIQYFAPSKAMYNRYVSQYAPTMQARGFDKWGNRFIAFRSVMMRVDEKDF